MSLLANRDIRKDVTRATAAKADYLATLLDAYQKRDHSKRVIAFCGHGRCGKDLGASFLGHNYHLTYGGSLSEIVCPLVAVALQKPEVDCFNERHADRAYWFDFCNELRRDDPTLLCKLLLSKADIIVGIRGAVELEAVRAEGIVDLAIWVDNPRVDIDPTLEYTEDDCDLVILNRTTKIDYFRRLRTLADQLFEPKRS